MANNVYKRILEHVYNIQESPDTTTLDQRLFDEAEMVLPQYFMTNTPYVVEQKELLLRHVTSLLMINTIQGHEAIANLLIKLFDSWTWSQILEFGTASIPFADGLAVGDHMFPFNKLMLALLNKASTRPSDAAMVAAPLETMQALVRLWLGTTDTGIAQSAEALLLALLKVDRVVQGPTGVALPSGGLGLVGKRIFGDRDVYSVFFSSCSLDKHGLPEMTKNQHTIAQARLMAWLPKIAGMDWNIVVRSHVADIEKQFGVAQGGGLLDFAATIMVDFKEDVLMYQCLLDFYADLLGASPPRVSALDDSPALTYLVTKGLHVRTISHYLQLTPADPVDAMFLYGPAANYIASYASTYPSHFLASQLPLQISQRMQQAFDMSSAKWAHAESPKHDLSLLASLPRKALLPVAEGSPLALLPSRATNPDVLNTLATVFRGPLGAEVVFPPPQVEAIDSMAQNSEEAATARALYFNYVARNPRFWQDVTKHADTIALKDVALAALGLLTSVITGNWASKPELALPTSIATPDSGHLAILSPPALEYVLPYLLKPAQSFSNLVGGRGDSESAAYKIASAKFDALKQLHGKLKTQIESQPGISEEGYEQILATLAKRLGEGPLSREGEVGGKVATLEL